MEIKLFSIGAILCILIFCSCDQQTAKAPHIEFEATIISIELEESARYTEDNKIFRAPEDSATIRIDKVLEREGDWSSAGIVEGEEPSLEFEYTARPAKIITVVGKTTEQHSFA